MIACALTGAADTTKKNPAVPVTPEQIARGLLRHFLAIIEFKSFTAAAEALRLTQPALTKSIKKLERIIGVTLLDRHHSNVFPTRYGEALASRAKLIELELARALYDIDALRGGLTGVINVGVGPSFIGHVADIILALRDRRPDLMVNISVDIMDSLLTGLIGGTLDVICTSLEFPSYPDIAKVPLLEVSNSVIASKSHPLAGQDTVEPKQLLAYPWVAFSKDNMGISRMGAFFAANNLRPPAITTSISSAEVVFDLLRKSDYLAAIPSLLTPIARSNALVEISTKAPFWRVMIGVAYRNTSNPPIAVREFINVCKRHFTPKKGLRAP